VADITVNLAERSYNIHINNSLESLGPVLRQLPIYHKILLVSDTTVGALYGERIASQLRQWNYDVHLYMITPGETSKSIDTAMNIYSEAISLGLDRNSPILALGGGVVGDLAGFVAATYLRGVPLIQIPSSLLAQIDSSVGGKVAVNHPLGKNLIGAFYQPKAVFIHPALLQTLPERELHSGLAEVIKYGMIADQNFFSFLEANTDSILAKDLDHLSAIIRRSCEIKAEVVQKDEREASLRMILNFGHTIGHALEAATKFQKYTHGEAVALGMLGAAMISRELGKCSGDCVMRLTQLLAAYRLPLSAAGHSPEELLTYIARDKKVSAAKINWILVNDIGNVSIHNDVPPDVVLHVLRNLTRL
jgi:3-dehydroquinate synthase